MNTVSRRLCQPSRRGWLAGGIFCGLVVTFLLQPVGVGAPANPPSWQQELAAAQLAETTAIAVVADNPSAAPETDRRLGELYRQLAVKYPDQPAVRKAVGDHFWRVNDSPTALAEWQAAQRLDPADAETANSLGGAQLREGNAPAAREQFERAVDARPGMARYQFDLANVLFLFRHEFVGAPALPDEATILREALGHFRRASELAADNVDFARAYAETFYGLPHPDWQESLVAWEHVRALSPAAPDFANSHLARVSLRLEKPAQAEAYLDLIHDPSFAALTAKLRQQAEALKRKETK